MVVPVAGRLYFTTVATGEAGELNPLGKTAVSSPVRGSEDQLTLNRERHTN